MVRLYDEISMDFEEYDEFAFRRWEKDCLVLKGQDGKEYEVSKVRLREMLAEKRREFPLEEFDK